MNRVALVMVTAAGFLVIFSFAYGDTGWSVQNLNAATLGNSIGCHVQYAQYSLPGLFDRGSCELNCRDRFRDPSTWTRDQTQNVPSADYLRCTNQCATSDWNELERSRNRY